MWFQCEKCPQWFQVYFDAPQNSCPRCGQVYNVDENSRTVSITPAMKAAVQIVQERNQHADLVKRADELRKQYQPRFAELDGINADTIAPLAYMAYIMGGIDSNSVKQTWLQAIIRTAILIGRDQSSTQQAKAQPVYDGAAIMSRFLDYVSALWREGQTYISIREVKDSLEEAQKASSTLPADVQAVLDAASKWYWERDQFARSDMTEGEKELHKALMAREYQP